MDPNEVQKRRILVGAGYEFHVVHDVWVNALLDRQLDGTIAQSLTVEQLVRWIKVGDSRIRTLTGLRCAMGSARPAS
jgi:hypothetical protein